MSTSSAASVTGTTGPQVSTGYDAYSKLESKDFLKLIIAELQSQDPMNPTDTSDMLNQFNQIRTIASNDKLSDTLQGVLLGQNVLTASNMIGMVVEGKNEDGEKVIGMVDAVQVDGDDPQLLVGGSYMPLSNVLQVIDPQLVTEETGGTDTTDATDTTDQTG